MERITVDGFQVLDKKITTLSVKQAEKFYVEHQDKSFFRNLVESMTSGPVVAMILQKNDAVHDFRALQGPTIPSQARESHPNSLRSLYGTDATKNATHASDSVVSANREIALILPESNLKNKILPRKLIIAGAPAAGKGTQCSVISQRYGCIHISTGDLLRQAVADKTPLGKQAQEYMDNGKLVPDQLIIDLVKARISQPDCVENGWLMDGFPRTKAQADALSEANIVAEKFILVDVPDDILIERCVGRRLDPQTGAIYHMKYNPPTDPAVVSRLTIRSDDTEDKMKVRISTFHSHIDAVIGHFQDALLKVDGNLDKYAVFSQITQVLDVLVPSHFTHSQFGQTSHKKRASAGHEKRGSGGDKGHKREESVGKDKRNSNRLREEEKKEIIQAV
jgi:adenylate kinase